MKILNVALIDVRKFAENAHGNQKYGKYAYTWHLDCVAANCGNNAIKHKLSRNERHLLCACGYLHDTVEDTSVTLDIIEKEFGSEVKELIEGITHDEVEKSYEEYIMDISESDNKLLKLLKISDLTHNITENEKIISKYKRYGETAPKKIRQRCLIYKFARHIIKETL